MAYSITSQVLASGSRLETEAMFAEVGSFAFDDNVDPQLTVETAQLDGLRMHRVASTGHRIQLTDQRHATYLLPRCGAIEFSKMRGRELSGSTGDAFVFSPNSRVTRVTPKGSRLFRASVLLVDRTALKPYTTAVDHCSIGGFLEHAVGRSQTLPEEGTLRSYFSFLEHELQSRPEQLASPQIRARSAAMMIELFGQLVLKLQERQSLPLKIHGGNRVAVSRALDFMSANLDQPLTLAQISAASGVSIRSLQMLFKLERGTTPRTALNQLRLDKVREVLQNPHSNATVTRAAHDCGFTHLGRFGAIYKAKFGECPSETLSRVGKLRQTSSQAEVVSCRGGGSW